MQTESERIRDELKPRLERARAATDQLFSWLQPDAWLARPIAERHRLIFELGHLEAFDWNLLARDAARRPSRRPHFEQLFAFGIDPLDGTLPADQATDWPSRDAISAWTREVRAEVDEVLLSAPLEGYLARGWAFHLAIEHRELHAETLCHLLARLPAAHKKVPPAPARPEVAWVSARWCDVPSGTATLGLSRAMHPTLGWDNEYDEHRVDVPAFRIAAHKVTNAQWLAFIEAGGYREPIHWTAGDAAWRDSVGLQAPASWKRRDGAWWFQGVGGESPLDLSAPVYVSHAEASAYAQWRGARLPTEAQWHRAVYGSLQGERAFPWGAAEPKPGVHGNFGGVQFDPTPVGSFAAGQSAFGLDEPVGNGWEWTGTAFAPFEGFRALPFYRGYSEPFFDGRHFVMKGGSPRTSVSVLRRTFRNWLQPHDPHAFATVRLVDAPS